MTATVAAEIQSLSPSARIELFVLDPSSVEGGGTPMYFHAGTNQLQQPVVWQGITYQPLPIEAEGFDITSKGTMPRPKVRVANIQGLFSALVRESDDLVGYKVIRKRTYKRFLDAINFTDGVNPDADPNQYLPDDVWFVERKVSENRYVIEWELSSAFDLQGVMLPYRQVIQNACSWKYRGAECGYMGAPFDRNDQPCSAADDYCPKKLTSCEKRFNSVTPGWLAILPFGGFPGASRVGG
jgi:lambda family phage minor tail protein L